MGSKNSNRLNAPSFTTEILVVKRAAASCDYGYNADLASRPHAQEEMDWARILAYVTGTVDQDLLSRDEHLATENRILKGQLKGRLVLSDVERATLGEISHRLGRKALADVANFAKPDTILGW